MKRSGFYAHDGQTVEDHVRGVADLAERFGRPFESGELARLVGLWHDVGKFSTDFRDYLAAAVAGEGQARRGSVDHSQAGALLATRQLGETNPLVARILAYCIAGHHGGLADWDTDRSGDGSLRRRLAREKPETRDALTRVPFELADCQPPALPAIALGDDKRDIAFQLALLTRMLFSCLVDADFLDTEASMDPDRASGRESDTPDVGRLADVLAAHLRRKSAEAKPTDVNRRRREVLDACRAAAEWEPGMFSLTVPTGGGKTLSSLAFALDHAVRYGLRRVIYAIPFTSIIEQNADCFREALDPLASSAVLEHHSNLEPQRETRWSRLASENWDAPLIATTNVQLLESLFASRTSRCRRLHHIARSVIVLDEAQKLPVELLEASLAVLRELARNYGCSVVLCTATQPAIHRREGFPIGIDGVREIIPDPSRLYERMRRTRVEHVGRLCDDELARRLADADQVLCVVDRTAHAATLYRRLADRGDAFHLSARMCPQHRSTVLDEIRRRLDDREPCRVVSTQLIEAGVDVDFPLVYRTMAGLDSIAQAAGRCNREGRLDEGRVVVFDAEQPPPAGMLRSAADTAGELIGRYDDLLSLEAVERYFALHYWKRKGDWDRRGVMDCFRLGRRDMPLLDFREAAARYRLIPDETVAIIIPWSDRGRELIAELRADPVPERETRRRRNRELQRYTVQVRSGQLDRLRSLGIVAPVCEHLLEDQYLVLEIPERYCDKTGLRLDDDVAMKAEHQVH